MQSPTALGPASPPAGGGRRPLRWTVVFVFAVALAMAAGALADRWLHRAPVLDPATLVAGYGFRDYRAALSAADTTIDRARRQLAQKPGEWLREEALARALIARFRLTARYDDLAVADRLLDAGLSRAPDPAGPVQSRVNLSLLVHRLPEAEVALARMRRWAVPFPAEKADVLAFSGDIAQQRGFPQQALRTYAQAEALAPGGGIELRQAVLLGKTGERDEAKRRVEALLARRLQAPRGLAELALQRAQLSYAEGDWDDAGRWVAAADKLFPGYWFTQAYVAQQLALTGKKDEAARLYAAAADASGSPEVMDALAQLLRLEGRRDESLAWWTKADAVWRRRLALFPEAAALHAAEHALIGGRPQEALALATGDVARRPHGQTIAVLARALILAGRPAQAIVELDRAEKQGWVSAGLLMLRSEAAAATGDGEASDEARRRAEAINPRAADPRTRLIWFGHD